METRWVTDISSSNCAYPDCPGERNHFAGNPLRWWFCEECIRDERWKEGCLHSNTVEGCGMCDFRIDLEKQRRKRKQVLAVIVPDDVGHVDLHAVVVNIPDGVDLTGQWLIDPSTMRTHKVLKHEGVRVTLTSAIDGFVHIDMIKKHLKVIHFVDGPQVGLYEDDL